MTTLPLLSYALDLDAMGAPTPELATGGTTYALPAGGASRYDANTAGEWQNTAAITSIVLQPVAGTLLQGFSATLICE